MSYNLKSTNKSNYFYIEFFGIWTRTTGRQILIDCYNKVCKNTDKKILLDFRKADLIETSPVMDYEEACLVTTFPEIYCYKFASLFKPHEIDRFIFWETVAVNRGIQICMFKSEDEAVQWLIKE